MKIQLPVMQCDKGCGECCGVVLCNDDEMAVIKGYIRKHNITPARQGIICPLYQDGQCSIYEVRPYVCRMFGHVPEMKCSRGYNVNIDPRMQAKLDSQYERTFSGQMAAAFLHSLVYSAGQMESIVKEYLESPMAECKQ